MAGVDGVRDRWVVAVVRAPDDVAWHVVPHARDVLAASTGCAAVGVDIPMGLVERGRRRCDEEARRRLGRRASSVFAAPVRAVLDAPDHRTAPARSVALHGAGLSVQSWGLVPKIAQWDGLDLPPSVLEVHPEVSFRALAGADLAGKRSARGAVQRLRALARWLHAGPLLDGLPDGVPLDDALDALACAWTAARWARGRAEVLGGEPDALGKPMRIVV